MTLSCGCLHSEISSKVNRRYNAYDLSGEYGIGYTNTGKVFYFDLEDYDKIKDYCWTENGNGYIRNIVNDIYLHRLIMEVDDDCEIDHIHGNDTRNDNRKSNLRIVTRSQNKMNVGIRENNHSGMTGVFWNDDIQRFEAYITQNNKRVNLGYYKTFEEAKAVRLKAQDEYFGEYSYEHSQSI